MTLARPKFPLHASAPGALSVCPASVIRDSGSNASQPHGAEGEPSSERANYSGRPGASMTRRTIMNSLVALPIVAALPVVAPAFTSPLASDMDAELVDAVRGLQATDDALKELCAKYGDDADGREDYEGPEITRDQYIATLIAVDANSMVVIQA